MHAVGNGVDRIFGKHQLRDLGVFLGDAVDVIAEVQGKMGHVEQAVIAEDILHLRKFLPPQHADRQLQGKLVVAGGHGRVRGEDAQLPDRAYIVVREGLPAVTRGLFVQQRQGQQRGMAFVEVKARDGIMAERPQHPHAADAKHHLLAESIVRVTAGKVMRQCPVPCLVFRHVGIEQVHRHREAICRFDFVLPDAEGNRATLYRYGGACGQLG